MEVFLASFRGRGEEILMVEDEESIRTAKEAFEEQDGEFDLVLTDVILPDMTGVQLSKLCCPASRN